MHNSIQKKIKLLRFAKGLTQIEFAGKLNMSQNAYSMLENGKTKLDAERIRLIAIHLDIQPDQLSSEDDVTLKFESEIKASDLNSQIENYKAQIHYLQYLIDEKDRQLSLLLSKKSK